MLAAVGESGEELSKLVCGLVQASAAVEVVNLDIKLDGGKSRGCAGKVVVFRHDLDRLDGEGLCAVLGEHGHHHVGDNLELGGVCGSDLNENVCGAKVYLGVLAIDDRGQGADNPVSIIDDWVDGRVFDDVKETTKVSVMFVELHQLLGIHLLGLVQGDELDVLRGESLIGERSLDSIQVMGTDRYQSPVSCQVRVELILQRNEGLIAVLCELDVSQDGTSNQRSDLGGLFLDNDLVLLRIFGLDHPEVGGLLSLLEDVQVHGNAFEAEHVISVGRDLDLELGRLLYAVDNGTLVILGVFVKFNAKLKAEILELFGRESAIEGFTCQRKVSSRGEEESACVYREIYILLTESFIKLVLVDRDGRHGGQLGIGNSR